MCRLNLTAHRIPLVLHRIQCGSHTADLARKVEAASDTAVAGSQSWASQQAGRGRVDGRRVGGESLGNSIGLSSGRWSARDGVRRRRAALLTISCVSDCERRF